MLENTPEHSLLLRRPLGLDPTDVTKGLQHGGRVTNAVSAFALHGYTVCAHIKHKSLSLAISSTTLHLLRKTIMETDSEQTTTLVLLRATEFQEQCVNSFCNAKGLWFNRKTKPNFPAKDNFF